MSKPFPYDKGCPIMMEDGRILTDHNPNIKVNNFFKSVLKATNETDYRRKLQEKGEEIIKGNLMFHQKNNTCACEGKPCNMDPLEFWGNGTR